MFKIKMDFDSRKFKRELEREVNEAAEREVKRKLRDLMARGLRVSKAMNGKITLDGPDDVLEEAQRRLR